VCVGSVVNIEGSEGRGTVGAENETPQASSGVGDEEGVSPSPDD